MAIRNNLHETHTSSSHKIHILQVHWTLYILPPEET